jgi:cob(I)alamin adenosyltransferase
MGFKIYTKTGDTGETSLFGGSRVKKYHERVEAYGTLDELNAFIGVLRDALIDAPDIYQIYFSNICKELKFIQDRLFTIGSNLASDPSQAHLLTPDIDENDVLSLEKSMDEMDEILPELSNFILPGGNIAVSFAHVARTVCRRAERLVTLLAEDEMNKIPPLSIRYLNRLSDYFFMVSRYISYRLGVEESIWKPKYK